MSQDLSAAPARETLTREAIIARALALLQEVGLEALSTRRLAASLGISSPSLYWHFATMAELRDHMADALLADALPEPDAPGSWRSWLALGALGIRRVALSHRDGARLLAASRPNAARRALRIRGNLARLEREGFTLDQAGGVFIALSRYALGAALAEQGAETADPRAEDAFTFGLEAMLNGFAAVRRPRPGDPAA
ncbi:MAG: TetR/AcrR family transcriptional regulator C-terminal domain-containing protein [Caulobacter sp.]|nr:TetR/AcrR family transcriptional regulator C-terminal domain-containing protein [Caulobacter sp.]